MKTMPPKTLRLPLRTLSPVTRTMGVLLLAACACQSTPTPVETAASATSAEPVVAAAVIATAATSSASDDGTPAAPAATPASPAVAKPAAAKPPSEPKTSTVKPADTGKSLAEPTKPEAPAPVIEKPCLATQFTFPAVQTACKKGGVPKAKSLMKAWTNKAKEKGESYKCAACHDNQRTYTNKPNADEDLRKLLTLIK